MSVARLKRVDLEVVDDGLFGDGEVEAEVVLGAGEHEAELDGAVSSVVLQVAFLGGVFALVEEDELAGSGEEDEAEHAGGEEPGVAGAEHGEGEDGHAERDEDDDAHLEDEFFEAMEGGGAFGGCFVFEFPFPALEGLGGEGGGAALDGQFVSFGPVAEGALDGDVVVLGFSREADDGGG